VKDIFLATAAWQSPQAVLIAWKLPRGLSLNSVVDELLYCFILKQPYTLISHFSFLNRAITDKNEQKVIFQ